MKVQELADRAGVSARSVRHYDRAGLLPSHRLPNGYRDFDEQAIERVRTIKRMIDSGLPVQDIVTLLPCLTADGEFNGCHDSRRLLNAHIERLQSDLARTQHTLNLLNERRQNMTPLLMQS